jgi:aspartyl-tRNA(Asn)/glutamyl-tRNA(Gln) amidotransferase subunit C
MPRINPEEVREIAALARLRLDDDEVKRMTHELDGILGYIETVKNLDTADALPMTHAVPFDCPMRPDHVGQSLTIDEALQNAPRRREGSFEVPRIVPGTGGA